MINKFLLACLSKISTWRGLTNQKSPSHHVNNYWYLSPVLANFRGAARFHFVVHDNTFDMNRMWSSKITRLNVFFLFQASEQSTRYLYQTNCSNTFNIWCINLFSSSQALCTRTPTCIFQADLSPPPRTTKLSTCGRQ